MFGLMKARTCSLSAELKRQRRLHYCGTCKTIGSLYGQRSRALLNHDTVFLAEVLSALSGANRQLDEWNRAYQSYNCLTLPRSNDAMPLTLQYAAAATMTLTEFKLADHINDSKQRRWRAAHRVFSKGFRRAAAQLNEWNFPVEDLRRVLLSQESREAQARKAASSPDTVPDAVPNAVINDLAAPTAQATEMFLAYGARLIGFDAVADAMRRLGHAFGALTYLLDALEDYDKDARSNDFNAIRVAYGLTDERLPAEVRKQVADKIWALAAEMKTALDELPIESAQAKLFVSRLHQNLSPRLGARLPVVGHTCRVKQAKKKTLGERWREAVAAGRQLTEKRTVESRSSFAARMASPFVFASVLPIAFLFPQQTAQAESYRECMGLSLNLIALGSLAAALVGRLRFSADGSDIEDAIQEDITGQSKSARKAARKAAAAAAGGGGGSSSGGSSGGCCCACGDCGDGCDCCCDGCDCCDGCGCCEGGCDCCSGCGDCCGSCGECGSCCDC